MSSKSLVTYSVSIAYLTEIYAWHKYFTNRGYLYADKKNKKHMYITSCGLKFTSKVKWQIKTAMQELLQL